MSGASKQKPKKQYNKFGTEAALLLYNDDVNSFAHVIDCLIQICELAPEEAVSKTFFVHFNGIGVIKTGDVAIVQAMQKALNECGLKAEVIDNPMRN